MDVQPIKQYCRYCAFCCYGDIPYCTEHDKELTEKYIKRENHCADFVLSEMGDVETGKPYNPRRKDKQNNYEQLKI